MKSRRAPSRRFQASETFWTGFYALTPAQKELARAAWARFKLDPFDPALRTHKIHAVSARMGETVYAVELDGDLRVLFTIRGEIVYSHIIGTHKIYGR